MYIQRELEVALLKLNVRFVETLLYSQASSAEVENELTGDGKKS
jgi:hypothetical protein